ncbi:MAG: helix-turn-helix domain-containing protein [Candidatus Xenobiia bacterium LiM19]
MEELLTVKEAADILRMHYVTVSKMVRRGSIPSVKIGRRYKLKQRSLQEWINRHERGEVG